MSRRLLLCKKSSLQCKHEPSSEDAVVALLLLLLVVVARCGPPSQYGNFDHGEAPEMPLTPFGFLPPPPMNSPIPLLRRPTCAARLRSDSCHFLSTQWVRAAVAGASRDRDRSATHCA